VFRQFIVTFAVVSAFVVLTTVIMSRPLHAQTINEARQSLSLVHSDQQLATCPGAPPVGQHIVFDFCSPRYNGDVAGPSGSHIVLVAENFPQGPQTWVLSQDKPITDAQSLNKCLKSTQCTALPPPGQSPMQTQETVLSWTWSHSFPQQINVDYYFIAIIGKFPGSNMQVLSTPVGFTLLTAQPPCIILEAGSTSPTNCSSAQQRYSIKDQASLTIRGVNWMPGWSQTNAPITESVTISATCTSSSVCNPTRLFDITIPSGGIDSSGSFTKRITLPTYAKGMYSIQASDSVQQIATPGVSDNSSINTVADGSLTFGEQGDAIALNISVIPQLIQGPNVELIILDIRATLATIPAIIGICLFVVVQSRRKKIQPGQAIPQLPVVYQYQLHLIPFQMILSSQIPILVPAPESHSSTSIKKQMREANKLWVRRKKLREAVAVTRKLLLQDFPAWQDFVSLLQKESPKLSPVDIQSHEKDVIDALMTIRSIQNSVEASSQNPARPENLAEEASLDLLAYCSMALVYGSVLFAIYAQSTILNKAHLHHNMGFVYMCLAGRVEYGIAFLFLDEANKHYQKALKIYQESNRSDFAAITLTALGDSAFLKTWLSTKDIRNANLSASEYYKKALDTLDILQPPLQKLPDELRERLSKTNNFERK